MTPTQEHLFKLLLEIDDICKRNGIDYFLDQGTILGVVRHGGFLPWDNDLDICMTEPNYDKFVEACHRELDHKTRTFCDNRRNREFPTVFGHYIDMTCCRMTDRTPFWDYLCGQTIDVFCLVELPGDLEENKRISNLYFAYDEYVNQSFRHYFRKTKDISDIYNGLYAREKEIGRDAVLAECEEQIFGHHYDDCTMLLCTSARMHWNSFLPKSMYDTAVTVQWNGHDFRIPGDWYEMMTINYGDGFYRVPKNPIVHSEQSHTEYPVMAYVDDFLAVTNKDKLLKDRFKAKQYAFQSGYKENIINTDFFKFVGVLASHDLSQRLQDSGQSLMDLVRENTLDSALKVQELLGDYLKLQCNDSVQYWRAHFGHSDAADCAILYVYLVLYGNIQPMIRLMMVRLQNNLPITSEMKRLMDAGKTFRKMKKSYYYGDIAAGREAERWVWENMPRSEAVRSWHLLYEFLEARGMEEGSLKESKLNTCIVTSEELLVRFPDSDFIAKVKADALHELNRLDEARLLYLHLKEQTDNGFMLREIDDILASFDEEGINQVTDDIVQKQESPLNEQDSKTDSSVSIEKPMRRLLPIQEKLINLIQEIDDACAELGIHWALQGETAAWAKAKKRLYGGQYAFHIMMRAKDALRLKSCLLGKARADRAIEDMSTNPKLPFNYLRYVDTSTTLIDKNDPVIYQELGVAVTIHPLFSQTPGRPYKEVAISHAFANCGWEYGSKPLTTTRKRFMGAIDCCSRIVGKAFIPNRLYQALFSMSDDTGEYLYEFSSPTQVMRIKTDVLDEAKRTKFNGLRLPMPKDPKTYIKQWYGAPWAALDKDIVKPQSANKSRCIHSAERPYKETLAIFEQSGLDYRSFQIRLRDYALWYNDTVREWERIQENGYAAARRSRDRIDIHAALLPNIQGLRRAYKNNDVETLKDALEKQDYFGLTDRFFARGLGFYINDEIFSFAKAVWSSEDKADYAEEIMALVPEYYKQLNLEEFLKGY